MKILKNNLKKCKYLKEDKDEDISYMVIFGDDPDNFNEVRDFSEIFDTEEEAVQFVKDNLALSEYRFALVDEEEPSGSGRTFTVNPQGEVEEVTDDYWKYSYTDYEDEDEDEDEDIPKYWFSIYELDENGNEIDQLDSYPTEEEAKEFADSLDVPAHVVIVPEYGVKEEEIDALTGYYAYQAIYNNKKAKEMGLDESLTESVDFKFDYNALFQALDNIGIADEFEYSKKFLKNAADYIEEADKKAKEIKTAFQKNLHINLYGPTSELFDDNAFIQLKTEINDVEYHIYVEDPKIYCWFESMEGEQEQFGSLKELVDYFRKIKDDVNESLKEDVKKLPDGKYANVGKDGKADSGKFKTKKEADAQRKAMFANGYKGESLKECDKFKYDDDPYDYDEYHEYEEEKIDYDDDPTMNY